MTGNFDELGRQHRWTSARSIPSSDAETLMVIVLVVFWVGWHIVQIRMENAHARRRGAHASPGRQPAARHAGGAHARAHVGRRVDLRRSAGGNAGVCVWERDAVVDASRRAARPFPRLAVPHPADRHAAGRRPALARHAPARADHDGPRTVAGADRADRAEGAGGEHRLLPLPGAEVARPARHLRARASRSCRRTIFSSRRIFRDRLTAVLPRRLAARRDAARRRRPACWSSTSSASSTACPARCSSSPPAIRRARRRSGTTGSSIRRCRTRSGAGLPAGLGGGGRRRSRNRDEPAWRESGRPEAVSACAALSRSPFLHPAERNERSELPIRLRSARTAGGSARSGSAPAARAPACRGPAGCRAASSTRGMRTQPLMLRSKIAGWPSS